MEEVSDAQKGKVPKVTVGHRANRATISPVNCLLVHHSEGRDCLVSFHVTRTWHSASKYLFTN